MTQARPALTIELDASEFGQWYWLREELATFLRERGHSATGNKEQLASRVTSILAGRVPAKAKQPSVRKAPMPSLFTLDTRVEPGWRCSQKLREFLTAHVGKSFHFTAHTREMIARADCTLAEVIDGYRASLDVKRDIAPQFEYNRHMREYMAAHPQATRDEARTAWWQLRNSRKVRTGSEA